MATKKYHEYELPDNHVAVANEYYVGVDTLGRETIYLSDINGTVAQLRSYLVGRGFDVLKILCCDRINRGL